MEALASGWSRAIGSSSPEEASLSSSSSDSSSWAISEPKAIELVGKSWTAVAVHGRQNEGSEAVWLGGRATALCRAIGASLRDAGFAAEPNERLPGLQSANICNRTLSSGGAQLELP
ncbi:poly-gamma-glutamate hydrolase family protein [Thalassospira sp.]|uniref:poly-gamma-glutamate hydrolase family protein n=1 Tax=Thalassospira sp. TaxID=1912094 RepID=UPI003AA97422